MRALHPCYFVLFLSWVIALANGFDRPNVAADLPPLAMVGVINVPIVNFLWIGGIHCISQPVFFVAVARAIDSSMLTPLVLMLIGAHGYFVIVVILRMRALLAERRLRLSACARGLG